MNLPGFFLVLMMSLSLSPLQSQTLHLICVGEDLINSGTIGGVSNDISRAYNEFKSIAGLLKLRFNYIPLVEPRQFTQDTVLAKIRNIPMNPDIVVFYYSGHGYSPGRYEFPYLQVTGGITSQTVADRIRLKSPRFFLLLTDCCNNPVYSSKSRATEKSLPSPFLLKNITELFKSYRGEVLATSASYGEEAYMDSTGSYFTRIFFDQLQRSCEKPSTPIWSELLKGVSQKTKQEVDQKKFAQQVPFYNINIEKMPSTKK